MPVVHSVTYKKNNEFSIPGSVYEILVDAFEMYETN
jgi:hypothetical protein